MTTPEVDEPVGDAGSVAGRRPATEPPEAELCRLIASLQQPGEDNLYDKVIRSVERVLLAEVMRQTHHNQVKASDILGIDRKTLRYKLRSFGLLAEAHETARVNGHCRSDG